LGVALACNIDHTGRAVRYRIGAALVLLGVVAWWVASLSSDGVVPWLVAGPVVAGGLFSLFEARRGWCAARALGFKTRV
jgi:hypothetical protein